MKKLSFWARDHKHASRIIIILSFIVLNGLGLLTGILLKDLSINLVSVFMVLSTAIFLIALVVYPSKSEKGKKPSASAFYIKQKTCDFILAASSFCMVIYIGNQPGKFISTYPGANAAVISKPNLPKDSTAKLIKSIKEFSAAMKDENGKMLKWKERKKLLKQQVKAIKKSNEPSDAGKTMLVVLSVIVALGLLALVGSLSCNLSCSGSDGAAILVGIGGTALVILLLVITIRAIYKKGKKRREMDKPATGS